MSALKKWSTACPDWEKRIVKAQTLIPFAPLFHENQVEALEVFGSLVMADAANEPTFGEICRPWINEFVGQIFGAYENETGIRHITEFFMLISKKNGKSTTAAGIMLTALILNWRTDAEFLILSPTKEIADNSFKPAASMVRKDPELSALFLVQDHIRTITHRITGATLKVVAADSATVSGKKAVGVLVDELWLFGKDPHAQSMLLEATGGLASRPEGFIIYLTTQSDEPPAGVFKEKLEYARNVRDGIIEDPHFLPVIYEFPPHMILERQHLLPQNFYITNPNMMDPRKPMDGGSVSVDYLQREYRKAQQTNEEAVRGFLAKHLNVEIGMNLRGDRWAGADHWESAARLAKVDVNYLIERCEVICVGGDGGGLDDLFGGAFIGRTREFFDVEIPEMIDEETGTVYSAQVINTQLWLVYMHAWAHPIVLKRRKDIATKIRDLEKTGRLSLVSRVGEDTEEFAAMVRQVEDAGLLYKIGLDPNVIGGIRTALLKEGIDPDKIEKVNQGYKLAGSIRTTERKLLEGVLVHDGNALGNWCVGNAKGVVKGNGFYITKQHSGSGKIDPLIALFNAVDLMQTDPEAQDSSIDSSDFIIAG